ncbi:MAG: WXG100 family type VII secretion target [Chloroflexota bacterium]
MSVIHMQVEQVREMALSLNQRMADLEEAQAELNRSAARLSMDWQGATASRFTSDLRRCTSNLEEKFNRLQELSTRLNREADEWLKADADGMGRMQPAPGAGAGSGFGGRTPFNASSASLLSTGAVLGAGTMAAPWLSNMGSSNASNMQGFDSGKWGLNFSKNAFKVGNSALGDMKYDQYKELGRTLNSLAGNQHAGMVGWMNDAGHFLKATPIEGLNVSTGKFLGSGVGGLFDFYSGMQGGEGLAQAGTSALITTGITLGASAVAAPVLLGSAGAQLVMGVSSLGLEVAGMHDAALQVNNLSEAVDLSGYISNISDGIADTILPPYDTPPDFSKVNERFDRLFNIF